MKRILAVVLVFTFVFMLAGCNRQEKAKEDIFNLVEKNYDAILKACEEKNADALSAIEGISEINIVDGYVIVYCTGAGIAPSSQEYGFYYSAENSPVTIDCSLGIICRADGLTPEGNGFQCVVNCNTFYTEQIKGNIYFYSNAY